MLNVRDTKKLTEGFRLIKEMILQNHNFSMFEAYKALQAKKVRVYSVKCDAFTVHKDDLDLVVGHRYIGKWMKGTLDIGKGIGQWKVEEEKHINFPADKYQYKFNEFIEINKIENENIPIEAERDTDAICEKLEVRNPCLIKGKYPGTGKSYIAEHFGKLGKSVCMVVPNNRQLQEKETEATTYNKFFSVAVDANEKLPAYDYEPYDVICFDEVYMCNMYMLNKVRLFCLNNPDKIIIGTGDIKQPPSLEDITNLQDREAYVNHCMDVIFKYNIFLTICKRVGGKDTEQGDKNRIMINEMYDDFWIHKLPMEEFIIKHNLETTDDIMASEHNIAFTNIRCRNVASEVRTGLGIKDKYIVGDILISRKWVKTPRINVNVRYCITKIDEGMITLQNISNEKDKFALLEEQVDSVFIYSYCAICHSSQGSSINKTMTIHEWDKPWFVSREWIWTALTRCVDFRKVKFYLNKNFDKQMELNMIKRYFTTKVEGYRGQDARAMREIDDNEEYVDMKWCMKRFRGNCEKCNVKFEFKTKGGKLSSNFTAQRVNNEWAHYKSNVAPWCRYCNCSAK